MMCSSSLLPISVKSIVDPVLGLILEWGACPIWWKVTNLKIGKGAGFTQMVILEHFCKKKSKKVYGVVENVKKDPHHEHGANVKNFEACTHKCSCPLSMDGWMEEEEGEEMEEEELPSS